MLRSTPVIGLDECARARYGALVGDDIRDHSLTTLDTRGDEFAVRRAVFLWTDSPTRVRNAPPDRPDPAN